MKNNSQHFVLLGIGSNIEPELNLELGLQALKQMDADLTISKYVKSKAVGFDGADFINAVIAIHTQLSVVDLKTKMKSIEQSIGIISNPSGCFNKKCDIDIISFNNWAGTYFHLTLPRKEVFYNAHVLGPLAQFLPDLILPSKTQSAKELWKDYPHKSRIEFL
ncbi:2-amino-4-hydroxy-6-hydroxymethyldihydropteridine diphosphokinase [Marinicellulosiphila megalodicopiae]|uniref:2-amino-4-hydroxy-6- hydroxymethyldihydropteridine diphosphokinase n=1 Tax=Marinicellulosiphila megalodicopiae TaxID=2724896 RepID=UPI003BB20650